jgi:hypothetical protein
MKPPTLWRIISFVIAVALTTIFFLISPHLPNAFRGFTWIVYLIAMVIILLLPWTYDPGKHKRGENTE